MSDQSTETEAPRVVEYFVSTAAMSIVRQHRWEADGDGNVLSTLREWAWNYPEQRYTDNANSYEVPITPDGTVKHDGRPLEEYARRRVVLLSGKRFSRVHAPIHIERTQ